jgi:hypothetical protein
MSLEIIFDKDFYCNFSDYKQQTKNKSFTIKDDFSINKEVDLSSYDYFKEINVSKS